MLKQNLHLLQSVVRQLRHSATLNVKSAASTYQQFDVHPAGQQRRQHHHQQQQHLTASCPNALQRIARKCLKHLLHQPSSAAATKTLQFTRSQSASSSTSTSSVTKCWSCSVPLPGNSAAILCPECGTIQPLPEHGADQYFQLFGLAAGSFALDTAALSRQFRRLQSGCHPDKFSGRSEREQQLSADWSSLVNRAYRTLLAPIKRGEYILRQHGIEVPEGNTAVASAFLAEMMERNEEVDDATGGAELLALLRRVRADLGRVVGRLDAALQGGQLETALADVIELRYLVSLESSIKAKCGRLGVVAE